MLRSFPEHDRRRPKKHHGATTKLTEGTKNLKKHARKILRSIGRVQKRTRQGNSCRSQGVWPDIRPEHQTIPRKRRKKKIWKGIASSRKQTLLGEVTAGGGKVARARSERAGDLDGYATGLSTKLEEEEEE